MNRANFLIATTIVEIGAGLVLLVRPALFIALLLGIENAAAETLLIARVAGAALFSLGTACGLARTDGQSRAATGLIAAMLLYNIAVAGLLLFAAFGLGLAGVALWPAVALHSAMAVWCVVSLPGKKRLIGK